MVKASLSLFAASLLMLLPALAHDAGHDHAAPAAKPAGAGDYAKVWLQKQENAPRMAVAATFDESGRLWLAKVQGKQLLVSHSDDAGQQFSAPVLVNREPELISADGEARPQLAVIGQRVYVSWTQALPQPFAGHVRFALSEDGGAHFSEPVTVNDDTRPITHRFNAMLADARGVTLAWIDKRDGVDQSGYIGAAIYTARSTDGGRSFAPNRKLADHSCECCRLGMAADRDGEPVLFWRHVFGRNVRDFALARLDGPLQRASEDGWEIEACPHHGGALAIGSDGVRHLAWFTGASGKAGLYYRRIDARQASVAQAFGNLDQQAGHPRVAVLNGKVHLVWKEYDGQHYLIRSQNQLAGHKAWQKPQTLAQTAGAADDPLLISGRKALWLIWHTAEEGVLIRKLPQ